MQNIVITKKLKFVEHKQYTVECTFGRVLYIYSNEFKIIFHETLIERTKLHYLRSDFI